MGNKPRKPDRDAYIYASARLHAVGNAIPDAAQYRRMADVAGMQEVYRLMEEAGVSFRGEESESEETCLQRILSDAFGLVDEIVPDRQLFDFFRYPYDCHNIKSALKARFRMADGGYEARAGALMLPCGTLAPERVIEAVKENRFDLFPEHMKQAAAEAAESYAKTSDPQLIDVYLDRACYRDMEASAAGYRSGFFRELAAMREDVTNLQICVRLLRMGCTGKAEKFRLACVPAGKLEHGLFHEALCMEARKGIAFLSERLSLTEAYSPVGEVLARETFKPAELEKVCEACCTAFVRSSCRDVLYGPEVAAEYLTEREREVKNLRIILSGKHAGASAETIRERLRD